MNWLRKSFEGRRLLPTSRRSPRLIFRESAIRVVCISFLARSLWVRGSDARDATTSLLQPSPLMKPLGLLTFLPRPEGTK